MNKISEDNMNKISDVWNDCPLCGSILKFHSGFKILFCAEGGIDIPHAGKYKPHYKLEFYFDDFYQEFCILEEVFTFDMFRFYRRKDKTRIFERNKNGAFYISGKPYMILKSNFPINKLFIGDKLSKIFVLS